MPLAIPRGQTVLFTGDSITDCGRRKEHQPLGCGYVRMAVDLIRAEQPDDDRAWVNTGIGGNTVRMLFDRWTDDVIRYRPDWLSVMIGINDCNRWLSGGENAPSPEEYAELYETILDRATRETGAKLVLMQPFYISSASAGDVAHGYRGRVMEALPKYIEATDRLAARFDARLVRTHEMFQRQLDAGRTVSDFGGDPVHPNQTGHLLMAHAWRATMED